jgi:hypothetical protein
MNSFPLTKIVVCGGGNGSHATIANAGYKPHMFEIGVFTRKPQDWKK